MERTIDWTELDKEIQGLLTDQDHVVSVRREAIPIIFVPGIMGSRLQAKKSRWYDGLPKKRWDPSSLSWMALYYFGLAGHQRKAMLVGTMFDPDYLEVIQDPQPSNGFEGIMDDYHGFLEQLSNSDCWGAINKIFVLPVYAFGFNWTGKVEDAGAELQARIERVIREAQEITGICTKVILITHSMGGLVARWASEQKPAPARDSILGIIHGVQPVTGSPAGYWRMKAGFEGTWKMSQVLGYNGTQVTPVLGNIPGGLSLLPSKFYRTNNGSAQWLILPDGNKLPKSDPYEEIYSVPAVVSPGNSTSPSGNAYWGLVDPTLLDPANTMASSPPKANEYDQLDHQTVVSPWQHFQAMLGLAKSLHEELKLSHHSTTLFSQGDHRLDDGNGRTADTIHYNLEPRSWITVRNYPGQGFRGFFRDEAGNQMQAVLADPDGKGDGTVPLSSSGALADFVTLPPGHTVEPVEHQPAYEKDPIQKFTTAAIAALCLKHYRERHG